MMNIKNTVSNKIRAGGTRRRIAIILIVCYDDRLNIVSLVRLVKGRRGELNCCSLTSRTLYCDGVYALEEL